MSSQHRRPFAAFVLLSVMCAFVMIHSLGAGGIDPARPGGFAVVDGPRQVLASGRSDLGQTDGPARTRVASVEAPRSAVTTGGSRGSSRATKDAQHAQAGRPDRGSTDAAPGTGPTAAPTTPPGGSGGNGGGKPTTGPTPLPDPSRAITRLKNRVADLAERSSQATGRERELLLLKLKVLRLRLVLAEIEAGVPGDQPPVAPSGNDPSPAAPSGEATTSSQADPSSQATPSSQSAPSSPADAEVPSVDEEQPPA